MCIVIIQHSNSVTNQTTAKKNTKIFCKQPINLYYIEFIAQYTNRASQHKIDEQTRNKS